jgi:hypothetical protein
MTSSDAIPPDETAEPRDGRVIRLGSQVLPGTNGSQPLVVEFEARVATGKASEALAREQAAAIREVLAWIAAIGNPATTTRVPQVPDPITAPQSGSYQSPPCAPPQPASTMVCVESRWRHLLLS